ncbi:uroporphyrinogen-III C-methyltransferase [Chitinilyticum piscinae]|uniref:Uroporphyrinogen-III C-methyltransferase n=1 Tax=Chitinilyticum piscinae TaxID=2866724 RepID=A0A8J7FFB8_9NEIS|nr:uroporphyrinogen-III C-methyltransferase [Chitinilyticum piscinae]MBE9608343.1 uroporphyrinogen-III C-methyltransferase [Chitinilyticum piscinae]
MTEQASDTLADALKPPVRRARLQPSLLLGGVALLACGALWLNQQQELSRLREIVGTQVASGTAQQSEQQQLLRQLQQQQLQVQQQLALLQSQQNAAASQQANLSAMYDALTRGETQRGLAEVEQTLHFASQQLQLAGNVNAALTALTAVDQKLAQLNRPELIALRQAIAKDTAALKSLPYLDVVGISARIDTLTSLLDTLPLALNERRSTPAGATVAPGASGLERFGAEVWHEFSQLIRIRRIDNPESVLLSPEQAFFLRENIKLRLLDARTALLLRNEAAFRADLAATKRYLDSYFDAKAPESRQFAQALQALQQQELVIELPTLSASLSAVQSARLTSEKVKP